MNQYNYIVMKGDFFLVVSPQISQYVLSKTTTTYTLIRLILIVG